ncbi:hypothetical protein ACEQPO_12870 [Bacillus sp. SL00103]
MMPGAGKMKGLKNVQVDEKQISITSEAIIKSMTTEEKEQPEVINASRGRNAIAKGEAEHLYRKSIAF